MKKLTDLRKLSVKKNLHVNGPVETDEDDMFDMDIQCQEIEGAIKANARLIGVISDFGGGKTSLLRLLARKNKRFKLCSICLWNHMKDEDKDDTENISSLTHSFLYQLAKEAVSSRFARHINRMISRNYGMISFGVYWGLWVLPIVIWVTAMYCLPHFLPNYPIICPEGSFVSTLCKFLVNSEKNLNYVTLAFFFFTLGAGGITYTSKESLGVRKPGIVDSYEIFDYIIEVARRKHWSKKLLICIEDLDRVESEEDFSRFIKEVYKYKSILSKKQLKKVIFLLSTSPESIYRKNNGKKADQDREHLYSKIFDYTVELKPIHIKQRKAIILKLLKVAEDSYLNITHDDCAKAAEWFQKGENLGVRDFKLRINKALSIYKSLLDQEPEFCKCAILSYLEDQYMSDIFYLVHNQDRFVEFMDAVRNAKENGVQDKDKLKALAREKGFYASAASQKKSVQAASEVSRKFMDAWIDALSESSIADDYEKYFFRYSNVKS